MYLLDWAAWDEIRLRRGKLVLDEDSPLAEVELGTRESILEDGHDRDEHLRRDIGVEVRVVIEIEL